MNRISFLNRGYAFKGLLAVKDECAIFSICGYSYFYYYCKPLISKPVFLLPRAANDLQTHN